jgi:signal transduction histidine kinase
VQFQVTDTGCGIAPTHLPQVFETFYRVPGQRSDTGSGLGLALVKQIIESHGGRVGVESVLNQGSTFWFTLPIAPRGGKADDNVNANGIDRRWTTANNPIATAR